MHLHKVACSLWMVLVLYMVCSISLAVPGVEALFVNWKARCLLASYTRSAAQKKKEGCERAHDL